ncbi:pseudouridine synthase [Verrucomicrobiales bacterium BCK34]|nr:pseudouridine synthase [Verrucomicrobiales bacterium BCK34]
MASPADKGVRLNKFLASSGVGSRRGCEEFITQGRVEINGKIVIDLSSRVREGDHVKLDGKMLRQDPPLTLILNKPKGYLCTKNDPQGRKTIYELIPRRFSKLHYVGRLDMESSGLLLMTSSGELTEKLTHPRYHVEKEYEVHLDRALEPEHTQKLLDGIHLSEGLAKIDSIHFESRRRLRVVLTQGINRQIRRMFPKVGCNVKRLERIRIGNFRAPALSTGEYQILNHKQIDEACKKAK